MIQGTRILAAESFGPVDLAGQTCDWSHGQVLDQAPGLAQHWDPVKASEKLGVGRRQWALGTDLTPCDLAEGAARKALAEAGLRVGDLDLLITATSTPGQVTSSLAGALARRLGVRCVSQDVRAGGAGGLQALRAAERWIAGTGQVALVVACEVISPWLDLQGDDPALLIFGDGAAALVLESYSGPGGCQAFVGGTYAPNARPFTVPGRLPPRSDSDSRDFVFQKAEDGYARALQELRNEACTDLAAAHAASGGAAIQAFFPMAPTQRSAERQAKSLGVDAHRTFTCLQAWGCPGAAAPLIGLANSWPEDATTMAFAAVGGGVHSTALTWNLGNTNQ